jgi:hypothetical protein
MLQFVHHELHYDSTYQNTFHLTCYNCSHYYDYYPQVLNNGASTYVGLLIPLLQLACTQALLSPMFSNLYSQILLWWNLRILCEVSFISFLNIPTSSCILTLRMYAKLKVITGYCSSGVPSIVVKDLWCNHWLQNPFPILLIIHFLCDS